MLISEKHTVLYQLFREINKVFFQECITVTLCVKETDILFKGWMAAPKVVNQIDYF